MKSSARDCSENPWNGTSRAAAVALSMAAWNAAVSSAVASPTAPKSRTLKVFRPEASVAARSSSMSRGTCWKSHLRSHPLRCPSKVSESFAGARQPSLREHGGGGGYAALRHLREPHDVHDDAARRLVLRAARKLGLQADAAGLVNWLLIRGGPAAPRRGAAVGPRRRLLSADRAVRHAGRADLLRCAPRNSALPAAPPTRSPRAAARSPRLDSSLQASPRSRW